ncbi:hypothetical protein ACIRBX_12140 [Kitasatospora sp. NPDC096147]
MPDQTAPDDHDDHDDRPEDAPTLTPTREGAHSSGSSTVTIHRQ